MKTPNVLFQLYERWRVVSIDEGTAIRAGDWDQVAACQSEKEQLQHEIQALSLSWAEPPERRPEFQQLISELMSVEKENQTQLLAQLSRAEGQRAEWQNASRHLRQIHHAYGTRQSARWESYS